MLKMEGYLKLTAKELRKELTEQGVLYNTKDTKDELVKKLFIHNFEKIILFFPKEKIHPRFRDFGPRKQRYISLKQKEVLHQQLKDIKKFTPLIETYPEQEKTLKNYNDVFDIDEIIYQRKKVSICKLKNGMYMCINDEKVYVCESLELIVKNLNKEDYYHYYIYTEKLEDFNQPHSDEVRHMKVPSRFDYMLYIYYKILMVETTFESLDKHQYVELTPEVDEIYWSCIKVKNFILYRNGKNFCLIKYEFKPESRIKILAKYTSKSYASLINKVLTNSEYREYIAATRTNRNFELIKRDVSKEMIEKFVKFHSEIKGEAIDLRNLTKEPNRFRGLSTLDEYYAVNVDETGTFKSLAVFTTTDKKYMAYAFYIRSKCTRDFQCITYMYDIKEYIADSYEDLINGFSESDFEAYLKL